jgi:hypothetical protein
VGGGDTVTLYNVKWEIEVEADCPEGAAVLALEIQRDPTSLATVFSITNLESGREYEIDTEGGESE